MDDLEAKERDFRRVNKELEERTRHWMKEVDSVINGESSNNCNDSFSTNKSHPHSRKCVKSHEADVFNGDSKVQPKRNVSSPRLQRRSSVNIPDELPLKKGSSLADKTITNFLKAKIDILQNELEVIRVEYKKKTDYCTTIESENKSFEEQKHKLQNQIETLKETIAKLENTNGNLRTDSQTLTMENSALKKDVEEHKKQAKQLQQQLSNYDIRLNRSLEDNEKLRNTVKCLNIEEKELRNQIRKSDEEKRLAIKKLEKQRSDLIQAFKRQTLLVGNLKKQNACLAASGKIQFTEEEFARLLDRKSERV